MIIYSPIAWQNWTFTSKLQKFSLQKVNWCNSYFEIIVIFVHFHNISLSLPGKQFSTLKRFKPINQSNISIKPLLSSEWPCKGKQFYWRTGFVQWSLRVYYVLLKKNTLCIKRSQSNMTIHYKVESSFLLCDHIDQIIPDSVSLFSQREIIFLFLERKHIMYYPPQPVI